MGQNPPGPLPQAKWSLSQSMLSPERQQLAQACQPGFPTLLGQGSAVPTHQSTAGPSSTPLPPPQDKGSQMPHAALDPIPVHSPLATEAEQAGCN